MRMEKIVELRKIHHEIKSRIESDSATAIQEGKAMLLNGMKKVLKLNWIARAEGLLALEEAVLDIPLASEEEELRQLIILLVDGTDAEVLEGIAWSRYYAGLYSDYAALRYFMYLEGTLSIQAGVNPWLLEEKLKTMLPHDMYLEYSMEQEQVQVAEKKKKEENLIKNLCRGERLWNSGENGYYVSKLTDYVICDITDKELQRVMREIDNFDLTLAMKGMSGEARKHIFANLSERLGSMLAEDMVSMGPVRAVDILEASQKLLTVLIRLIDIGEISGRYEYLEPFYNTFEVDTKVGREKNKKIEQLRKMVEEYEQGAELVKEVTDAGTEA